MKNCIQKRLQLQGLKPFCFFLKSVLKFIYFEKATKFCEIFTLFLSYVVPVKSEVKISQNYVAFSEYMNFMYNFMQGIKWYM